MAAIVLDIKLPPMQQKIFNTLSDGKLYSKGELVAVVYPLEDPGQVFNSLKTHICHLRKNLESVGMDVRYVTGGGRDGYMMFRKLGGSDE